MWHGALATADLAIDIGLSEPGTIRVGDDGYTKFTAAADGKDRYVTVTPDQITRVREALVMLASQPPVCGKSR